MSARQHYVILSVLALGALFGFVLAHGLGWVWSESGLSEPLLFGRPELPLSQILAYGLAVLATGFVFRHAPSYQLATEIVDELAKVSWPSKEETGHATWVVICTVLVCSLYLGLFDAFWLWLTNMVLGTQITKPG